MLVILIQNNCNMNCRYCFANGGSYGLHSSHMTTDSARSMINSFVKDTNVTHIGHIKFFGGEASAYPEVIESICDTFDEFVQDGILDQSPEYILITNGTYYSERLSKLIRKNNIFVTFSLDGDKELNDQFRICKDGKGSYDIVANDIDRYLLDGVDPNNCIIESTYTAIHLCNQIEPEKLATYFLKRFNINGTLILPCTGTNKYALTSEQLYLFEKRSIKQTFENFRNGNNTLGYNLDVFTHAALFAAQEESELPCNMIISEVTLTPSGKLYPCYMRMDNDYLLANYNKTMRKWYFEKLDSIIGTEKKEFNTNNYSDCNVCWAKYVCHHCPIRTQPQRINFEEGNNSNCLYKELSNDILLQLALTATKIDNFSRLMKFISHYV